VYKTTGAVVEVDAGGGVGVDSVVAVALPDNDERLEATSTAATV
jgi:hypothetical protein